MGESGANLDRGQRRPQAMIRNVLGAVAVAIVLIAANIYYVGTCVTCHEWVGMHVNYSMPVLLAMILTFIVIDAITLYIGITAIRRWMHLHRLER